MMMVNPFRTGNRCAIRPFKKSILPALLSLVVPLSAFAADPPAPPAAPVPAGALDLAACLNLALQRQPRIAAARASLAAAEDGKQSLDNLLLAPLLDPEIPIRRKQACLGVQAAAANLERAEHEAVYAVTRTYYTVLFAREQEIVARGVVNRLTAINEATRRAVESGARNVASTDVNRTTVYLRLAQTQQYKAAQGVQRALIALREAIGLGPECGISVPEGRLPTLEARPDRHDVVAQALARRGELVQVSVFAEVACLEVQAQSSSVRKRVETFAAGSDIHARQVPQDVHNDEYRPGGIVPEMPTLLAGCRQDRVRHARSLQARAEAMVEGTRNLIALEAEDAFLRWEQATQEVAAGREAMQSGDQLADDLDKDYTSGQRVKVEDVVNARVLAAQARARYNEALYHQILALADVERATAGGVCSGTAELAGLRPIGVTGDTK
jgi:outer membrane protein